MSETNSSKDVTMAETTQSPPPVPSEEEEEPKYGGYSRFEIELECLAHPHYLNHLAAQKYLENPAFVAYLSYLQYWSLPPYSKFLQYPGPTLKHLELLQQEKFRVDILSPHLVQRLVDEGIKAAVPQVEGS